jgi:hypothetical protein
VGRAVVIESVKFQRMSALGLASVFSSPHQNYLFEQE